LKDLFPRSRRALPEAEEAAIRHPFRFADLTEAQFRSSCEGDEAALRHPFRFADLPVGS
jgi:hypothetical protein